MFNEIPLFIFIRALGFITDKEILDKIIQNAEDNEMFNVLKASVYITSDVKLNTDIQVKTQEEAINYLINKLKNIKKFNSSDEDMAYNQKNNNA